MTPTRTLRVAGMAMVALLLMTGAAQARPLIHATPSPTPAVHVSHPTAVTPAIRPIPHRPVGTATGLSAFDWTDAALGAGSVLVLALFAGTATAARGRRRTALSH